MVSPIGEATDRCGSCGNDLRSKARFCDACGTPVTRLNSGEHKQVTVLFVDVVGSMKLAAAVDAERLREIMNELLNRAAAVVQRYRGTVDKFTGDGLMALFGAPAALEDHALRACIAALEIHSVAKGVAAEVFRRDGVGLRLRVGLNSGDVIAGALGSGPGNYTAVGHPVGMAQRMESAAPPDGVMCSMSTARLVEDVARLGPVENLTVKGVDQPVPGRRLLAVETRRTVLGRNDSIMLDREEELSRLLTAFTSGNGGLVGIVGEPGLGKSRLVSEFAAFAASEGARVVVARGEAHASTLAFRMLSLLLRGMFQVEELSPADARSRTVGHFDGRLAAQSRDARILFEAMGIGDGTEPEVSDSVDDRRRRLVEMMTTAVQGDTSPVVFVIEDAHWIDSPSDDVLSDFATELGNRTAAMVLATYRPEFRGALRRNSGQTIRLQPLTESATRRLVNQLLGDDATLAGMANRIAGVAAGNPYFVEEIVRDLAGRGVLSGGRGGYRMSVDTAPIVVPPTVQAVLAARIDRLPAKAKSLLNAAAVIGAHFDPETLHVLRPDAGDTGLSELVSAELIDQTEFVPRQRYCFHHPLVRTVAYESQLSRDRAQAHRRLAVAIEDRGPAAAEENAALIATHFEAAGEQAQAYHWHMRAARWLRSRDLPAAREQWERARNVADELPEHDGVIAMRVAPRTMLVSTSLYVGSDADTAHRYREFRDLATRTDDTRSLAIGTAGQLWAMTFNDFLVPEAVGLAAELHSMLVTADWDGEAMGIVVNAVAFAWFANCRFDSAIDVIDLLDACEVPDVELRPAQALRGVIELCLGQPEQGRRNLHEGIAHGRALQSRMFTHVVMYAGTVLALGLCEASEFIDDLRAARECAESSGDTSGILCTKWSYGTALLRGSRETRAEAIGMLEHVRSNCRANKFMTLVLPAVITDLARDAAQDGRRDEACVELRANFALHMGRGSKVYSGCVGEALVELLVERGAEEDLAEARHIVDQWQAQRPGIPALDLWWLRSRALLAQAERDMQGYANLSAQYLRMCEKLNARGRLDAARSMG
ncbi:ATP-binding protein [Mycolicibacterium sp. XJ870]